MKISVTEKIGYGLGDAAANFIFQTMLVFQLAFYTDTFGITAAAAGTLFLVVRVWEEPSLREPSDLAVARAWIDNYKCAEVPAVCSQSSV